MRNRPKDIGDPAQSLPKLSSGSGFRHASLKPNIERDAAKARTMAALAVIDSMDEFMSQVIQNPDRIIFRRYHENLVNANG